MKPKFSVIIPVLNEQENINAVLLHIDEISKGVACEVIVVDGDSEGSTLNCIKDSKMIKVAAPQGRARQMNKGASAASADILVFLHADTRLPCTAFKDIETVISSKKHSVGAFNLNIDSENLLLKLISLTANMRVSFTKIPYGDQAVFMTKKYFEKLGGYKDIPLMEDVELMRRIKKTGSKICIISAAVSTSPRRWLKGGILRNTLKNHIIRLMYYAGVPPAKLAEYYKSGRTQ